MVSGPDARTVQAKSSTHGSLQNQWRDAEGDRFGRHRERMVVAMTILLVAGLWVLIPKGRHGEGTASRSPGDISAKPHIQAPSPATAGPTPAHHQTTSKTTVTSVPWRPIEAAIAISLRDLIRVSHA